MAVPDAFDEAVKGCDVIAHVASLAIGTVLSVFYSASSLLFATERYS